jgi:Fe-S cluster assembly protein SufD
VNLSEAIRERDVAKLPGRRDEDWRWTDLRGLIRQAPAPSAPIGAAPSGEGPFAALAARPVLIANGVGERELVVTDEAVVALDVVGAGEGGHAAQLKITVAPGAVLTLLESYRGTGGYLSYTALEIEVGVGATVERIVLADEPADAVGVTQAEVTLAPTAEFAQTVLASGARRQRVETRVRHPGGHASVRMDGAYLLAGKRHADITTAVTHAALDGVTDQLVKGVVRDQARGVFQGRIVVAQGADHTEARMGHHALILSDQAELDARPELEIYADDVTCSHGNTVGALDDEALFYMRQRGVPEAEARALLTEGFVGEVLDRIAFEPAREIARAWAVERLRG